MAKKFVRGITDITTINNQDFDTNNVNDLLSDGKNNYIHRRKGDKSEEYHCLTDNIKTIKSSNENLLKVTNDNDNNTVTLSVNFSPTTYFGERNILRNTSSYFIKDRAIGDFKSGSWGNASRGDGSIEVTTLKDAPLNHIIQSFKVVNNTTGNKDLSQANIPVVVGAEYTLSYYIRKHSTSTSDVSSLIRVGYDDFTVISNNTDTISSSSWTRKSLTFTPTTDKLRIQLGQAGGGIVEICGIQLEKGSTPTDYSINTWDVVEKLPTLINSLATADEPSISE